jgi:hypothetical protein
MILDNDDEDTINTSSRAWTFPWLGPSSGTLLMFGGLDPIQTVQYGAYWRLVTSAFIPSSFLDLCSIYLAWTLLYSSEDPWDRWAVVYLGSILTGQLWMLAWDATPHVLTGCITWGTGGVLCAAGVARPNQRFIFFVLASILVLFSFVEQPTNSVLGMVGGSYFGWALSSSGCVPTIPEKRQPSSHGFRFMSGITAILMVLVPAVCIAFAI